MANMIKFYKGLVGNLPATGTDGALYITTDEGGIYLGTGTGMKRLGDFVQVDNVAALPEKAHENCLYYCVAENILAKWNGTEWKQVNKQPTTEELKGLLGLGSMAYVSEVAESNLSAALAEKVNAASEGNHSHANKTVLDGITAEKVTAWDAAEGNAKTYADGLNTTMDTRVKTVEGTSHTHTNKALLDTYTQTEENLADAVAKKHEHENKTELDKIVAGDKAKWDAVVADHLTSADKTAIEDSIGDVNTALGEEVTRAKAAEKANADAITAIKDGASVDSFADVETELAKKVDKAEGKSLVADTEIVRLAAMSDGANKVEASEANGKIKIDGVETVVYTHPEKHAISDVTGLQDALDGKQAAGDYAAEVHTHVKADITDFAHTHTVSDITDFDESVKAYDYATQDEAKGYADAKDEAIAAAKAAADKAQEEVDALETYVGTIPSDEKYANITNVVAYVNKKAEETLASATGGSSESAASVLAALNTYKSENDPKVQANIDAIDAIEADYLKAADKTELSDAIAAEKTRAEGIEAGLRTDVDAIKADYLKAADKQALQTQIDTIMNNPDTEGVINSINEFTQYIADHGEVAEGFRTDIDANAKAIEDHEALAAETYETKTDATAKLGEAKEYADGLNTAMDTRVKKLEAIDHEAYKAYADQAEADAIASAAADAAAKVKALEDGAVATNATNIAANTEALATKANSADVYAKTETYTKDEVDAAVEAAVTAATEWGSF